MNQTTMRHLSINAKSGLGVFKQAHLLERLSVMLLSLIDAKSRCVVPLMGGDVPTVVRLLLNVSLESCWKRRAQRLSHALTTSERQA